MAEFNVWSYLAKMGASVKGPGSRTLAEGDKASGMLTPTLVTLEDIEEFLHTDYQEFSCQAPGCKESFSQLHESELHYDSIHRHSCATCKKSLPSPHLLELHIQESHDSFFAVMSERKPSYQCFLPTCDHVSWNPGDRHQHAILEHSFPPDYRFDEVKRKVRQGNNKQRSKKKTEVNGNTSQETAITPRRPLSLANLGKHFKDEDGMEVDGVNNRMSLVMENNVTTPRSDTKKNAGQGSASTGKKSKIPVRSNSCKVPRNLSFGAGIPRGFLSRPKASSKGKHWHQMSCDDVSMEHVSSIDSADMNSLRDSLPT